MNIEQATAKYEALTIPEPNTGCLLWLGGRDDAGFGPGNGYGRIVVDGVRRRAHHLGFFLKHGRWPEPCGLHKCDTTACVNGDHIFEGDRNDNIQDMKKKGRTATEKPTHCPSGHEYTAENTYIEHNGGESGRYQLRHCKACRAKRQREYIRRRRR